MWKLRCGRHQGCRAVVDSTTRNRLTKGRSASQGRLDQDLDRLVFEGPLANVAHHGGIMAAKADGQKALRTMGRGFRTFRTGGHALRLSVRRKVVKYSSGLGPDIVEAFEDRIVGLTRERRIWHECESNYTCLVSNGLSCRTPIACLLRRWPGFGRGTKK